MGPASRTPTVPSVVAWTVGQSRTTVASIPMGMNWPRIKRLIKVRVQKVFEVFKMVVATARRAPSQPLSVRRVENSNEQRRQ